MMALQFSDSGRQFPAQRISPGAVDNWQSKMACRVCGNTEGNRAFAVNEVMFELGRRHDYFQCGSCMTIQIRTLPVNRESLYPRGYFSFESSPPAGMPRFRFRESLIARFISLPSFEARGKWFDLLTRFELSDHPMEAVGRLRLPMSSKILDVGSGSGKLLRKLRLKGYQSLTGVDPFLNVEPETEEIRVLRAGIEDLPPAAKFDLVILWHSLEHTIDPIDTMNRVRSHLEEGGIALIAMPVVGHTFNHFGTAWFQLDPPRHIHLFSEKGFSLAAAKAGLKIVDTHYDSVASQFRLSARIREGRSIVSVKPWEDLIAMLFSRREAQWRALARTLNRAHEGDQAVYYLTGS